MGFLIVKFGMTKINDTQKSVSTYVYDIFGICHIFLGYLKVNKKKDAIWRLLDISNRSKNYLPHAYMNAYDSGVKQMSSVKIDIVFRSSLPYIFQLQIVWSVTLSIRLSKVCNKKDEEYVTFYIVELR